MFVKTAANLNVEIFGIKTDVYPSTQIRTDLKSVKRGVVISRYAHPKPT